MPIQDWNIKATFDTAYKIRPARYLNQHPNNGNIPEFYTHYHNTYLAIGMRASIQRLVTNLSIPTGSRIVVIGAGYAWTVEWLNANGYIAIPVDTSTYLNANYNNSEETEIVEILNPIPGLDINTVITDPNDSQLKPIGDIIIRQDGKRTNEILINENLSNNGSRRSVHSALNKDMDYIITENMLSTLNDTELIDVAGRVENLKSLQSGVIVIHSDVWTDPIGRQDTGFNWKSGVEWRTFFDTTLNLPNHVLYNSPTGEVA